MIKEWNIDIDSSESIYDTCIEMCEKALQDTSE